MLLVHLATPRATICAYAGDSLDETPTSSYSMSRATAFPALRFVSLFESVRALACRLVRLVQNRLVLPYSWELQVHPCFRSVHHDAMHTYDDVESTSWNATTFPCLIPTLTAIASIVNANCR